MNIFPDGAKAGKKLTQPLRPVKKEIHLIHQHAAMDVL
jgi:hypothetical protein